MVRFQRFSTFYPHHIQQFYARQPNLINTSYATQHAALWADGFNWAHYLCIELAKLGYETCDIPANVEPIQKQWAQEHGLRFDESRWYQDIALAQIKAFQPEVLYANFEADFVKHCRMECPSIKLVIGWAGEPIVDAALFQQHDLVLSCVPENVAYYRAAGIPSEHFNHAFEPTILQHLTAPSSPVVEPVDFAFIGSVLWGEHYHNNRAKLFYELIKATDLALYGGVSNIDSASQLRGVRYYRHKLYYAFLERASGTVLENLTRHLPRYRAFRVYQERKSYIPIFEALRQVAKPPVFGLEMYQLLSNVRVCLNAHAWSAYASNMRLYEATGVGTCLLTDWKQNIQELFEPDKEVVTYRNAEECVEKVSYLLDHEHERRAIALAGQQRTLRDHTTEKRAALLNEIILEYLH